MKRAVINQEKINRQADYMLNTQNVSLLWYWYKQNPLGRGHRPNADQTPCVYGQLTIRSCFLCHLLHTLCFLKDIFVYKHKEKKLFPMTTDFFLLTSVTA